MNNILSLRLLPLVTLLSFLIAGLVPDGVRARTWEVYANGSGDVPTIQAAIDVVAAGDTILVMPGSYTWTNQGTNSDHGMLHVPRGTNDFTLRSRDGAAATVLNAQSQGRVMFIAGWNNMVIEGFTFRGGEAPLFGNFVGGGIAAHLAFDVIRDCVFLNNNAAAGGALWCGGVSGMRFENCEFRNNTADRGAAIYLINSPGGPTFDSCVIRDNVAAFSGGAIYTYNNPVNLVNTLVITNSAGGVGGGLDAMNSDLTQIDSCTFSGNSAPAGASINLFSSVSFAMTNTILAFGGSGGALQLTNSDLTVSCSNVFGHTGGDTFPPGVIDNGGNFSLDPHFCDTAASDYTIRGDSPCAIGNHPGAIECGLIGAFPVGCGLVPVEVKSFSDLKALYRGQ